MRNENENENKKEMQSIEEEERKRKEVKRESREDEERRKKKEETKTKQTELLPASLSFVLSIPAPVLGFERGQRLCGTHQGHQDRHVFMALSSSSPFRY